MPSTLRLSFRRGAATKLKKDARFQSRGNACDCEPFLVEFPSLLNTPAKAKSLRESAIGEFHDSLATDKTLSAAVFKKLRDTMRSNHLLYGDRPIGVALRPHFLDTSQFAALTKAAEAISSALEKVAAAALRSPDLMTDLGLSDLERKLALVDPGFANATINARIDGFVHDEQIRFVEYNAENPSSLSDQEGLNRLLAQMPATAILAKRYRLREFSVVEKLRETLLDAYREWGGGAAPNIAILDWKNLPTEHEFILLRDAFAEHGTRTIICSPDELEYDDRKLKCGDFRIDLVYKRILVHEFLARYDDSHPLIRAYLNRDVCLVNPFCCKILHKKASFEILTDERNQNWFDESERKAIRHSVPWTRRVSDRKTSCDGREIDLLRFIAQNRASLVLKPNDDYGGRGVFIGPRLSEGEWDSAMATALSGDYVVQDALDLRPEEFPIFSDTDWSLQPMFVDTNPFLFRGKVCGAMVRLSSSPVVNVTAGGGETGFFVIESEL